MRISAKASTCSAQPAHRRRAPAKQRADQRSGDNAIAATKPTTQRASAISSRIDAAHEANSADSATIADDGEIEAVHRRHAVRVDATQRLCGTVTCAGATMPL